MTLFSLIIFSFLLSLVPFSVGLNSSVYRCIQWKEALRVSFYFALFQMGMVVIGWFFGHHIKVLFRDLQVPMAILIILFIAARVFADARRLKKENRTMAVENIRILIGFSFVISINAALLSMGLGILYDEIVILAGFVFGIVFLMTIIGVQAGKRGMIHLGRIAETIGGTGLFLAGIIIALQYLKIL